MPIRPYRTAAGQKRWQADVGDARRGLPRTKRSFKTRKEAEDWVASAKSQTHDRYIGKRERHTFGQALTKYLTEESPRKKTRRDDVGNANALRFPVRDGRRWLLLEHVLLEDMIPALNAWLTEQRLVTRRRYIGGNYYLERVEPSGERAWYLQPDPSEDETPRPRELVRDRELLEQLNAPGGRGPYSPDTLRVRQVLAGRILRLAWKRWGWLEHEIAGQIELEAPGRGRELFLTEDELEALIAAAASAKKPDGSPDPVGPHFADAIAGAACIGWRRANTLALDWSRVIFPVYEDTDEGRKLVQVGVIWTEAETTKNGEPLAQPIGDELLELLRSRWEKRVTYIERVDGGEDVHHNLVFHDGTGRPFGDTRRRFATAKRAAGVRSDFRWHDLRHTWASHLAQRGVSDRHLQELGGWKDGKMVQRYSKLKVEHLLEAVNRPGRRTSAT